MLRVFLSFPSSRSHILVVVTLVPLIHLLPICKDRLKTHLSTFIKDALKLLLKLSKSLIQVWVLEAFRSRLVWLTIGNIDTLSFFLLALFSFSWRDCLVRFDIWDCPVVSWVSLVVWYGVHTGIKALRHLIGWRSSQRGSTVMSLSKLSFKLLSQFYWM